MYNLILVDVGADRLGIGTCIHRMNVITGDYLHPRYVSGSMEDQIKLLIDIITKDMPDKIIFDKSGYGYTFYDMFRSKVNHRDFKDFKVDAFGLITY